MAEIDMKKDRRRKYESHYQLELKILQFIKLQAANELAIKRNDALLEKTGD